MPYTGRNWPNVDTESKGPYTYDFSDRIPSGDDIDTVTWELKVVPNLVYTGVDSTPQTHVSTESNDELTATAWLDSLVANTRYKFTAFIVTTGGFQDDLYSYVICEPKP